MPSSRFLQAPLVPLYLALVAIAAVFVCFTFAITLGVIPESLSFTFYHANLAIENNPAAWFAGALLFLAGAIAFDEYLAKDVDPQARRGWLAISLVLFAFSADEMSSLHERVSYNLAGPLGLNRWVAVAPFGLVLLGLLAYGFTKLFRHAESRGQIYAILVGFAILLTVPAQEFLEHYLVWGDSRLVLALRVAVEESTELAGSLAILRAISRSLRARLAQTGRKTSRSSASRISDPCS